MLLQQPEEILFKTLQDSCKEFIEYLRIQYTEFHPVACILAFDEAQELTERPITRKQTFSLYHDLGLVLKAIGSTSVFSVFISTNPNIWSLAPLVEPFRCSPRLCPPVTELPFDVFASNLCSDLRESGECTLTAACQVEVMARFGRAM